MLIKSKDLKGYKLGAKDGFIGKTKEFYFDDKYWTIRYLVADTGGWLSNRAVLISPYSLESIDLDEQVIYINLTKHEIEHGPSLLSDQPVSHQFEESYNGYYGWPMYWGGYYPWGMSPYIEKGGRDAPASYKRHWDPHLRSTHSVAGYHIQAFDGEIGHIQDFIIDDTTWAIRYLVIKTANWLAGKEVLISPQWIENISWVESKVFLSLSKEEIRTSPEYSAEAFLNRAYENDLYAHYQRDAYWNSEKRNKEEMRLASKEHRSIA
jgi:hypothetical protein